MNDLTEYWGSAGKKMGSEKPADSSSTGTGSGGGYFEYLENMKPEDIAQAQPENPNPESKNLLTRVARGLVNGPEHARNGNVLQAIRKMFVK